MGKAARSGRRGHLPCVRRSILRHRTADSRRWRLECHHVIDNRLRASRDRIFFSLRFSCCVRATSNQLVLLSRHLRGSAYQALSSLTGNPFALSLVHPAAKKAAWPGEFRRETSRIHRWPATGRPLVMLLAAYNVLLVVLPTPALQSEWLALLLFEKTP
jgi:hypothetical protein